MIGVGFRVSVSGLKELIGRLLGFSLGEKHRIYADGMKQTLEALGEAVPPYPHERRDQKYVRTERLGQSLGSGFGGGTHGLPDVYEIKASGGAVEGRFGSNVGYAEYVIGEGTQAWMHVGRWWTVKTWLRNAEGRINSIWQGIGARIAAYINGKG